MPIKSTAVSKSLASVSLASLAVAACLAASPASAASLRCESAKDGLAVNTRVLQTNLMVAALMCGERQNYNAFVTTFRNDIAAQGSSLKALFKRTYGGGGKRELNNFVTKLANDASMDCMKTAGAKERFCARARAAFADARATSPGRFADLVNKHKVSGAHTFANCR